MARGAGAGKKETGMKSKKIGFSDILELSGSHQSPTLKRLERFERLERRELINSLQTAFVHASGRAANRRRRTEKAHRDSFGRESFGLAAQDRRQKRTAVSVAGQRNLGRRDAKSELIELGTPDTATVYTTLQLHPLVGGLCYKPAKWTSSIKSYCGTWKWPSTG